MVNEYLIAARNELKALDRKYISGGQCFIRAVFRAVVSFYYASSSKTIAWKCYLYDVSSYSKALGSILFAARSVCYS